MGTTVDSFESYVSMVDFLETFYVTENQIDLGVLLGNLNLNANDGQPMDPAMRVIWQDVFKELFKNSNEQLSVYQVRMIIISFLERVSIGLNSIEIASIIECLKNEKKVIDILEVCITNTKEKYGSG